VMTSASAETEPSSNHFTVKLNSPLTRCPSWPTVDHCAL
jgi:hypothetical protein